MDLSTVLPASVVDLSKRSNIVTIFCAIPELGSVFPVNIDITQKFIDLKGKIKEAKPHTICFDADMLRLYLTKNDGMWLNWNHEEVRAFERGEIRERVKNLMLEHVLLDQDETLNHDAYFGKRFKPVARDIHVLVEMPEDCEFPGSSNMVTIYCAIPGTGSVFPVHINTTQTFGDLKNKIKEMKPHTICFDADMLRLYLTKRRGAWLNWNHEEIRAFEREVRERVGNLMLEHLLLDQDEHDAYFGKRFKPVARDIHVLVEMPEDCEFPGSSNMVTIYCAIPGTGSVFPVHINTTQTFGDLKNKIKEAKPNLIRYDADLLKLYLAKNSDGWLSLRDDNISALLRREVRDGVKDLMKDDLLLFCGLKLNDNTAFGKRFSPVDRDIHVLVKEAEDPTIVRHYKKRKECVKTTRDVLFTICTFIVVVAVAYGINPEDEKGCITSGVPAYVCILVAIAAGLLYGGMRVLLDIKEKGYEDEIVKAYMTMGYPYQPIP